MTSATQCLIEEPAQRVIVGIADLAVSDNPSAILVTYALGSCIAVCVYDPVRVVAGMIHYMLPQSSIFSEKSKSKPAMFANTGVPMLFHQMYDLGSIKENLVVKVVGGGALYDDNGVFEIGKRNYSILTTMFSKSNIVIAAEDVGGCKSRTVRFAVGTGQVIVSSQGTDTVL